jgi:hypothetical protein
MFDKRDTIATLLVNRNYPVVVMWHCVDNN